MAILASNAGKGLSQTEPVPSKSTFSLFNPTPDRFLRQLSADRPDKTDCPFTVDAGHVQIEMDLVNMTYAGPNPQRGHTRATSVEVAPMNVKVGLLDNLDFQVVYAPYRWDKIEDLDVGTVERNSGFNGVTPRFKLNLIGNDGGFFALALLPFIKFPLSQERLDNRSVEGGVGVPYAIDLPGGWDLGFQSTFRVNRNGADDGDHIEFDNSVSVGHRLVGKLSLFAEFFSNVSAERGAAWVGTVDTWLTYEINGNLRLDGGVYIGVTPAAEDWHPWIGMTWRY
jgi:hypothetical protein